MFIIVAAFLAAFRSQNNHIVLGGVSMVSNAKIEAFEQYLMSGGGNITTFSIIMSLLMAALFAYILAKIYERYGTSLSNRKKFAGNFILLATTTTLIISIIKSSLALSLGLVGALSIIRFRAAIKEPEELAFLFLVIAIGLGFGANQVFITIIAFAVICGLLILRHLTHRTTEHQNLCLLVSGKPSPKVTLKAITDILKKNCSAVHLKRLDENDDLIETSFFVDFDSFNDLDRAKSELRSVCKSIKVTYLDKEGIS